jgi:hypothetical protein
LIEINENSLIESLSRRVDLNPMFIRQEDVGNEVKLGITKGTTSRRQWKLVQDPTRSDRLRERQLQIREVMCTWCRPVHSGI